MSDSDDPKAIEVHAQDQFDRVRQNPYAHFVLSELQGAASSLSVYFAFHLVSYLIERISEAFPLRLKEPAQVLDAIFAWGAVIGGGGSFCIITLYSMLSLWRELRKGAAT